jgi:hypothetical protein
VFACCGIAGRFELGRGRHIKLGYTEFSFGYAFTENLIRASAAGPSTAPVFPNLVQEAKAGYDVKIDLPGLPLFFQYKLPELMTRNTAYEIATYKLAGITIPFFRMPLMPSGLSKQHELLIELEKRYPQTVLYASPGLRDIRAFNRAYTNGEVHRRSVFFSPNDIGPLPDAKAHTIAYRNGLAYGWLCSEPREINAVSFDTLEHQMQSMLEHEKSRTLRVTGPELREKVRSVVSGSMREAESLISEQIRARRAVETPVVSGADEQSIEDILVAREMVRVDLGVELVMAQPRS